LNDGEKRIAAEPVLNQRLAIRLAMAMFVFVIDTSLMNVSISAVVRDLNTTTSGVQSAIAVEALVSAAFILIGSKIADLWGRKRAFILGLALYAAGAVAMTVAQGLAAIIVFWAVIGGFGAALYFPAMQALIHGNFEGEAQVKVFALVGAAAAIGAAIGPLIGGFLTTLLSWRVGFLLEALIIAIVLSGAGLIRDVPYTGERGVDVLGSILSVLGMGCLVLGILAWQEGGDSVAALLALGLAGLGGLVYWLRRRKREGKPVLLDPNLFRNGLFSFGILTGVFQQIALGGLLIALPIYLQLDLGYNALQAGVSLAPFSLTIFGVALLAGRRAGKRRQSSLILAGFALLSAGLLVLIPVVPQVDTAWYLVPGLLLCGAGMGLLVSQINSYTLSSVSEERAGEASGVNSAVSSFGLSMGLAFAGAILLAALSITLTNKADASKVLTPAEQERVADALEDDAQVMSDAQLEELLVGQPQQTRDEIVEINDDARPEALQFALLVPLIAALADPVPSRSSEMALG
jgi:LPXTG-motif cell wall-anchored protein